MADNGPRCVAKPEMPGLILRLGVEDCKFGITAMKSFPGLSKKPKLLLNFRIGVKISVSGSKFERQL